MDELLKWLCQNGRILLKAGELIIELGRAVVDSVAPPKPKAKRKKG